MTQSQQSLLNSAIQKFKFEELESTVLPEFPEITWNQIRAYLIKNHESFTTVNVLKIINRLINAKKISEKDLKKRLNRLEIIDISRHSNRKMWHAYELKNRKDNYNYEDGFHEIQNNMSHCFNALQMKMHIKSEVYNDIMFIIIRERKTRRLSPICIALFLEQDIFFCSNKAVSKEFLHVIVKSTGYSECKKILLSGKNISSLIKIHLIKKRNAVEGNDMCIDEEFEEAPAIVGPTGIDFKQNQHRRKHLEQYFGHDEIILESLIVKNRDVSWADPRIAAKLPNVKINMQCQVNHLKKYLLIDPFVTTPKQTQILCLILNKKSLMIAKDEKMKKPITLVISKENEVINTPQKDGTSPDETNLPPKLDKFPDLRDTV
ncbi:uncharacterized protein LOC103576086 isoform X2 [Microplitis demolitor]|uniref:uncharacterized protein LOC103576086 isoform X2 n=1 Tax=Microplitis demolitor TaxID=69319 RepID=UPI0004CD6AF4|nr:uncharacterized protein LOC103576086 isoform X2 [Microplitis demolitor]